MDLLSWLIGQRSITSGLTIELFAGRGMINRSTADTQIELIEEAIASLAPGYEMKSLAWLPVGRSKGIVGQFDKVGWNRQRKQISGGKFRKHAAVAWREDDQQDFFVIATERTDTADSIRISSSAPYASALCVDVELVEKLVQITRHAWSSLKLRYGYGNLGITDEGMAQPRADALIADWSRRSAVPLANVTPASDARIARGFDKKVKGAFWLNLLNPAHVRAMGGIEAIDEALPADVRIEEFANGGLLVQLTQLPAPDDSPQTQEKFASLAALLGPIVAE